MQLVRRHRVKAHLLAGLESGLASRRRDWDSEVTMFGRGGGGGAGGVEWGGYGLSEVAGEISYFDARESYIMRAFGGQLGSPPPERFVIVAFDGSGGKRGSGVGVSVLEVASLDVLSSETVDVGQVRELDHISSRMPEWYGDGESNNQAAEDVAGAAAVLACLREGGVLVIGDNLQTVTDIVEVAEGQEKSAREAMRHRNQPSLQTIRYIGLSVTGFKFRVTVNVQLACLVAVQLQYIIWGRGTVSVSGMLGHHMVCGIQVCLQGHSILKPL